MDEQLTLFETPTTNAPSVWETLSAEERAFVVSVLTRVMAKAVAELADQSAYRDNGHD